MKRRSFLTASGSSALAMCLSAAAKANFISRQPADQLDAYITGKMGDHRIPGLALAVVRNGKPVRKQSWGKHCVELDVNVTTDSVFQVFSVSKILAGVSLAILLHEQRLAMDDLVAKYLDGMPQSWSAMRVKHLLNHTCGLRNYFENPEYQALGEKKPAGQVIAAIAEMPLSFAPGDGFRYNQSGNFLFSVVLQKVSGIPYEQFVQERIFRPSGIQDAAFGGSKVIVKNRPPMGYNIAEGVMRHWEFPFTETDYPSAGLNISASGFARFFAALQQEKLVPRSAMETIWAPTVLNNGKKIDYGQSWSLEERDGSRVVGHEGGGCAWVEHNPDHALSVAVICNLNGVRRDEIVKDVSRMFLN